MGIVRPHGTFDFGLVYSDPGSVNPRFFRHDGFIRRGLRPKIPDSRSMALPLRCLGRPGASVVRRLKAERPRRIFGSVGGLLLFLDTPSLLHGLLWMVGIRQS